MYHKHNIDILLILQKSYNIYECQLHLKKFKSFAYLEKLENNYRII
jgi:hypothetical protein